MGYYPTEKEIENITNEIKFSTYIENNELVDSVDFETLIKRELGSW